MDDTISCSIERSLSVLGERWTFLVLREALLGTTRFAGFRSALGIAPDVLTERLTTLVAHGVLSKAPYREPGQRARDAYVLTPAGQDLGLVLASLAQWGDEHLPRTGGPSMRRSTPDGRPVSVAYIDPDGHVLAARDVRTVPVPPELSE